MTDYLGMMRGKKQKCTPKGKRKFKAKNERGNLNQNLESITCFQILPRANPGQKISRYSEATDSCINN